VAAVYGRAANVMDVTVKEATTTDVVPQNSFPVQLGRTAVLILLFALLNTAIFQIVNLPESAYFQPVIFAQAVRQLSFIFLLLWGLVPIVKFRDLRWGKFENGRSLRFAIFLIALILAWSFSTYDYNHYYNQAHYFDRFLLILLALLIWLHPIFVSFFVLFAIVMARQFSFPLADYSWTDKRVLFDVLILFSTLLYAKLFWRWAERYFLLLGLCLFTANYVMSAAGKLSLNWLAHDDLADLVVAGYVNGWFPFWSETAVLRLADLIHTINLPLLLLTLLIEIAPIFLFLHRRLAIIILLGVVGLHLNIFLSSGIFFWKWIALALIFVFVLMRLDGKQVTAVFNKQNVALSLFIFLLSPLFFHPVQLAWYDTPFNNFYRLEAVGESGRVYEIDRHFLAPYDIIFAQNRFWYLNDESTLVGTYGAADKLVVAVGIQQANSAADMQQLSDEQGQNYFDAAKATRFKEFVQSYFGSLNENGRKTIPLNILAAPQHIWSYAKGNGYDMQEPVHSVRVNLVKTWYVDSHIRTLSDEVIQEIAVYDN
jgi:hypothetical protein